MRIQCDFTREAVLKRLKALLQCHSKEKLQMQLHWDPPCNLSAPEMRRVEKSEELLALKVLHCSSKLGETSALQLIFLTEINLRTLMMRLSLGFPVSPGMAFVQSLRGTQLVSTAGN